MNYPLKDKVKKDGIKKVVWLIFVWGMVISLIISPIAVFLI